MKAFAWHRGFRRLALAVWLSATGAMAQASFHPVWSVRQDLPRLFWGTMHFVVQWHAAPRWSFSAGPYITYRNTENMGAVLGERVFPYPFFSENGTLVGWGGMMSARHYLKKFSDYSGMYAGVETMYRTLSIRETYRRDEDSTRSVRRRLNIGRIVTVFGMQFNAGRFSFDLYAGGGLRLSRYQDAADFTRVNSIIHLDYSGIMPTAGFTLGILFLPPSDS